MVDAATLAFAFGLGVGTFFSPCSVALLPAYVAYFTGLGNADAASTGRARTAALGLRFGLSAAAGVVAVFAFAGAIIYWVRTQTDLDSPSLTRALAILALIVAVIVIGLGVLFLLGASPSWTIPVRAPKSKSVAGMMGFGALYAVASLGCTAPLFLAAMAQVFLAGALGGTLVLFAFAAGLGGLLVIASGALAIAQDGARRWLGRIIPYMRYVSGIIMILAGAYVVYYYVFAVDVL